MACATCVVAQQWAVLEQDPACLKAWLLWVKLATPFVFDGHALGTVFDRLTREYDPETYDDMVQRMAILYETFCPPPERP